MFEHYSIRQEGFINMPTDLKWIENERINQLIAANTKDKDFPSFDHRRLFLECLFFINTCHKNIQLFI